eukprot:1363772-Lingulodinium_polyedra.AAC.1
MAEVQQNSFLRNPPVGRQEAPADAAECRADGSARARDAPTGRRLGPLDGLLHEGQGNLAWPSCQMHSLDPRPDGH